jgi:hypothetical protein
VRSVVTAYWVAAVTRHNSSRAREHQPIHNPRAMPPRWSITGACAYLVFLILLAVLASALGVQINRVVVDVDQRVTATRWDVIGATTRLAAGVNLVNDLVVSTTMHTGITASVLTATVAVAPPSAERDAFNASAHAELDAVRAALASYVEVAQHAERVIRAMNDTAYALDDAPIGANQVLQFRWCACTACGAADIHATLMRSRPAACVSVAVATSFETFHDSSRQRMCSRVNDAHASAAELVDIITGAITRVYTLDECDADAIASCEMRTVLAALAVVFVLVSLAAVAERKTIPAETVPPTPAIESPIVPASDESTEPRSRRSRSSDRDTAPPPPPDLFEPRPVELPTRRSPPRDNPIVIEPWPMPVPARSPPRDKPTHDHRWPDDVTDDAIWRPVSARWPPPPPVTEEEEAKHEDMRRRKGKGNLLLSHKLPNTDNDVAPEVATATTTLSFDKSVVQTMQEEAREAVAKASKSRV